MEQEQNETRSEEMDSTEETVVEPEKEETEPAVEDGEQTDQTAEIEKLIGERDEYLEMAKRQKAEFANYRRRTENTRKEAFEEGSKDTGKCFLPVLDNLERALAAAGDEESPLKAGVEMVLRQMNEAMSQLKVECIDPQGEPFDAELMNAVLQGTPEEGEPGSVCQVLQKGYRMGDKVIRHAMVKVVAG